MTRRACISLSTIFIFILILTLTLWTRLEKRELLDRAIYFKLNIRGGGGVMITNGDFWGPTGTKNHGDSGKIVDVLHHLSLKVPIIFLGYYALDVEISLKYGAR